MNLQQQVQQHLQNTGISLRELSRRSGVSHTTIGKILRGGEYKSGTADALRIAMQPQTLDATVEQLAAQRVNADLTHHADWDTDLQCAKYRRVMQLEKELEQTKTEVGVWRDKTGQARKNNYALQNRLSDSADVLAQREQHLRSCENALIEAHEKIAKQDAWTEIVDDARKELQRLLENANAEIKRLTALSETHGQSWKAACVQVEQLQKQLDHGQAQFASLHEAYNQQIDDEAVMLAQIDTLFAERETTATLHDQQVMRLRVYVWILIAALAFVVASGLVVWGAK